MADYDLTRKTESEFPPVAIPRDQYDEDRHGFVLCWRFPVNEPPHVGSPFDWGDDYHTHFTIIETPITITIELF